MVLPSWSIRLFVSSFGHSQPGRTEVATRNHYHGQHNDHGGNNCTARELINHTIILLSRIRWIDRSFASNWFRAAQLLARFSYTLVVVVVSCWAKLSSFFITHKTLRLIKLFLYDPQIICTTRSSSASHWIDKQTDKRTEHDRIGFIIIINLLV